MFLCVPLLTQESDAGSGMTDEDSGSDDEKDEDGSDDEDIFGLLTSSHPDWSVL